MEIGNNNNIIIIQSESKESEEALQCTIVKQEGEGRHVLDLNSTMR